ncbi:MAG: hypothetical protein ACJASQ_001255 [Crocinitomicaceae bacterium]|jgi:hypothetical protein
MRVKDLQESILIIDFNFLELASEIERGEIFDTRLIYEEYIEFYLSEQNKRNNVNSRRNYINDKIKELRGVKGGLNLIAISVSENTLEKVSILLEDLIGRLEEEITEGKNSANSSRKLIPINTDYSTLAAILDISRQAGVINITDYRLGQLLEDNFIQSDGTRIKQKIVSGRFTEGISDKIYHKAIEAINTTQS